MASLKEITAESLREASDAMSHHFLTLLPKTNDISLLVLKGHLLVEECLVAMLEAQAFRPELLEKGRFTFHQLTVLVMAWSRVPPLGEIWPAVEALNKLRNELVHNLEPARLEERVQHFLNAFPETSSVRASPDPSMAKQVERALLILGGQLSVLALVSDAAELISWQMAFGDLKRPG